MFPELDGVHINIFNISSYMFHSEAERKLAAILEGDALKWFKPAKGQFQIIYRHGADHFEYIPDFVAETNDKRRCAPLIGREMQAMELPCGA
ncbi:hypothetical protein DESC_720460 [Desulfosarcina cetonica]|uniref:hypothetical protein n=1 Tax=Desulfosarcina cetonica TaxID=90730 RepID=UPI0006CFDD84|nr:hypothetical protein [Desulfosarcina cetonica]VTR69082.1 hypothetical protein DESC_720460 [Desulfosarcina cetonica]